MYTDPVLCTLNFVLCCYSDELEEGGEIEVNYLECEDASGYLVFNKEVSGVIIQLDPGL